MPDTSNILGASASVDASQAAEMLAQRIAGLSQEVTASATDAPSLAQSGAVNSGIMPPMQKVMSSAPRNANDVFDSDAFEKRRWTGDFVDIPGLSPNAPSSPPQTGTPSQVEIPSDPWADTGRGYGHADGGAVSRIAETNAHLAPTRPSAEEESELAEPVNRAGLYQRARTFLTNRYAADEETEAVAPTHGVGGASFSLGFGLMQVGSEGGQIYKAENRGAYLTPEQQDAASMSLLPGLGTVAGGLAGMALGNPVLGSMVGSGIGSIAEGAIGAGDERGQATRQAATELADSLGAASSRIKEFSSQIESSGVSAQQFQSALTTAGSIGTFGANTSQGIANLTSAFGERAGEDWSAIARYTSNPLLHGMGSSVSSGTAGSGDLVSLGYDAAEQSDFGALHTFQQAARDARAANDPQFQALSKNAVGERQSWRRQAEHWVTGVASHLGIDMSGSDAIDAAQKALDDRRTQISGGPDPVAEQQNTLINQFADLRSRREVAESGVGVATSGIGLVEARGGSAAQIGAASESLYGTLGAARAATHSEIGLLQGDLANPINAGRADELRARIAGAQAREGGYDVAEAQQRRSVYQTGLQEEGAQFNYFADRATLSGRSAASMLGGYNRQAEFLSGQAADPRNPLSPTERAGIEDSAARMRYSAYQSLYAEENADEGITRAGRDAAVSRAEVLGTPMEIYGAQIGALQSDREQLSLNASQVARGHLTHPQVQGIERQNVALRADLATGPERARVGAYDAQGGILSETQGADRALFSRALGVEGNSAFAGSRIFQDDAAIENLYAGAERGSPVGSAQRARFGRQRADAHAAAVEDQDSAYTYRQPQAGRVHQMQDESAFERAMIAPYMDGPESSPLTRGTAVLGDLRGRLRGEESALAHTPQSSPAYEANARLVEETKNQIARIQHEQLTSMFGALPESIIGAAGSGVMAGIVPTSAMTARFTSNPTFGSWGPGGPSPAGTVGGIPPGGAAGGFGQGTGANDIVAAINRQTDAIVRAVKGGGAPSPSGYAGGSYATKFNPMRPPM